MLTSNIFQGIFYWLKHENISTRNKGDLNALQDKYIFLEKVIKWPYYNNNYKSVDYMVTQCDRKLSHTIQKDVMLRLELGKDLLTLYQIRCLDLFRLFLFFSFCPFF